ncbi:MAG: histidine kinase [Saprospiraceae bacterium]|nr:histidine kinase [Saprospiraceae bacterium]
MRLKFLILVFVVIHTGQVCGQHPYFKNYQLNEGLLSNYVYSVFQDSHGYIWISSDVGVSRFDGQSFVHFNTSHGLPDNEVFSMIEDDAGRIWFATLNGKPGYFQHGVFYNESNMPVLKKFRIKGMILKLFQHTDGRIVYCSSYKTTLIDMRLGTVEEWQTDSGVAVVWPNPDGSFGGISNSFGFIEPQGFRTTNSFIRLTQTIHAVPIGDTLIVSANKSLHLVDWKTGAIYNSISPLTTGDNFLYTKLLGNKLWTGCRTGILIFDYPTLTLERSYLPGRSVSCILEDREGGLWISTFEEGVFYIPDPEILQYGLQDGLYHKRVISLSCDPKGKLWVGSEGSAFSILDENGMKSHVIFPSNVINKNIQNIRHFPDGSTLVISKAGSLFIPENGAQRLFIQRASDINININGDYTAGLNGLFEIPRDMAEKKYINPAQAGRVVDIHPAYGLPPITRLKGHKVEKIEFDQSGNTWVATHSGLVVVDDKGSEKWLLSHSIMDMEFDKNLSVCWVLSESKGLYVIQNQTVVDSVLIRDQFGAVICRDLCTDETGSIWIGSASGLFQVQGEIGALRLVNYRGVLGLNSDKVNAVEVMHDYVYIGKDDGLLAVPKNLLIQSPPAPPVLIKSVTMNGKPLVFDGTTYEMPYGDGALNLEFEGLSFREPQFVVYRYRMTGLYDTWHETVNEAIELASLSPGSYQFEVCAMNGVGETGAISVVRIKVNPPFWRMLWFYVLVAFGLLGMGWAFVKHRENRLRAAHARERGAIALQREKAELHQKITEMKMLALRLQMNPHFIFNALNTIKGYYGQSRTIEANAFISKFARLLRLNLDYSDAMIPLDQEIELLKIYLELSQTRYPDKFNFQIHLQDGINPLEIMIPSMLLQPFVENAVIHGVAPKKEHGEILVKFSLAGEELEVTIRDSGVGRQAASLVKMGDPHKPLATQITRERLQMLRGGGDAAPIEIKDLFDSNGKPSGTEVRLFVPFQPVKKHG